MGQFSWLDCITKEQVINGADRDVFVLIPAEFGGGHIVEHCYAGYGRFGNKDIFELVAKWNRRYISEHPKHIFPHTVSYCHWLMMRGDDIKSQDWKLYAHDHIWYAVYADLEIPEEGIEYVSGCVLRHIGIDIACYDEDNRALEYPIKITYNPDAVYEDCEPSDSDPNQGWVQFEDDEEDW